MRNLRLALMQILALSLLLGGMLSGCDKQEAATSPKANAVIRQPAPDDASVYFVTPADGATVTSPVRLEFGADGMTIVAAGTEQAFSGHHHLLIDVELPSSDLPIPKDANHIHFGDGSFSTEISLEPGPHTLQLLLGDHRHIPHDPPVLSNRISITVE